MSEFASPNSLTGSDSVTNPTWQSVLPELQVRSGRIVAGVVNNDDRLAHGFWWEASSETMDMVRIMTSCEGTPQDTWPASSPFQQIVREEIGTEKKLVLLAVGMAGKTHWSGTVEGDAMTEAIAMDFAARVNVTPDFLGSTYVIDAAWTAKLQTTADALNQSVTLTHAEQGIQLIFDSIGPHVVSIDGKKLTLAFQADFPSTKRNQTLRWRYVIRSVSI
ncbi:MAG: hypothetical protein NTW52_04625 [Planctomycetota bacterium]|nr:hypothetical protein [Planctomycetota bacterium]